MKALILVLTFFCIIVAFSQLGQATRTLVAQPQMKMNESSTLNQAQQYNHTKLVGTCSYLIKLYTSCNSPYDSNDEIYIVFGDAYGTQITAKLENVAGANFKPCMISEFRLIHRECMNKICKLGFKRKGNDGWMGEKVTVSDFNNPLVMFYFDGLIPDDGKVHGNGICEEL